MGWVHVILALFFCILSGLAGLMAGINLNPLSTVRFVPDWGIIGNWFSGAGTLGAVLASLWLARRGERRQEQREKEDVKIEQSASNLYASIRVISLGVFPVTIKNVLIVRDDDKAFAVPPPIDSKANFPLRLEFREDLHLTWRADKVRAFVEGIRLLEVDSIRSLRIEVWTVVGRYRAKLNTDFVDFLTSACIRYENARQA